MYFEESCLVPRSIIIEVDLLTICEEEEDADFMTKTFFCCKITEFPLKYLGAPLHFSKLRKQDLDYAN